nr:hypothetical protein [Tanacetum cinerariifolium]
MSSLTVTYTSAPPSPNYVPSPEHLPSPDYVHGLEYPKYLVPSDDEIPIEDQPLPVDTSPTALSPGYITDLNPEEDLEEDPKDDPEEDPADDEDEEEASEVEEEEDDEENEKHLAPADSFAIPIDDPVPSAEETEPFETDESAPTPPSPRLSRARIFISLPPLPLPSPPLPLPAPSSPLLLHATDRKEDVLEADVPPQKRLCLIDPAPRFEDDMVADIEDRAPTTLKELSQRVTDFGATPARDTHEMTREQEPARDLEPEDEPTDTAQGIADALAEYEAHRSSRNGDDSHDFGSGGRTEPAARECTYSNFLKCQPFNFIGTEGVVGLTQWFEKMESIFHISNCTVTCQIKFATCTLQGNALTWWNSHVKTVGHEVAYGMT